jgi:dolichol-phosphate mannosyltransferase
MRASIVIPIHNEAGTIIELHSRLVRTLAALPMLSDHEIIFVDDASSDGSSLLLDNLAAGGQRTLVLKHARRCGQTAALRTGINCARFEFCLIMDGDLQVVPEDIPALLGLAEHHDVVNARRSMRQDRRIVVISSKLYNTIMRRVFRSPCMDSSSNFTLFRTSLMKGMDIVSNDHRYLIPLAMRKGARRITEVAVRHSRRTRGRSKYSALKAVPAAAELVAFWWRLHRGVYD